MHLHPNPGLDNNLQLQDCISVLKTKAMGKQ